MERSKISHGVALKQQSIFKSFRRTRPQLPGIRYRTSTYVSSYTCSQLFPLDFHPEIATNFGFGAAEARLLQNVPWWLQPKRTNERHAAGRWKVTEPSEAPHPKNSTSGAGGWTGATRAFDVASCTASAIYGRGVGVTGRAGVVGGPARSTETRLPCPCGIPGISQCRRPILWIHNYGKIKLITNV